MIGYCDKSLAVTLFPFPNSVFHFKKIVKSVSAAHSLACSILVEMVETYPMAPPTNKKPRKNGTLVMRERMLRR